MARYDGLITNRTTKAPATGATKRSKWGNTPTTRGKLKFDSKKEAYRFDELVLLQEAGEISDLELEPTYVLQEAYTEIQFGEPLSGERIRALTWTADFRYEKDGRTVVEDVKGSKRTMTQVFHVRVKLFRKRYPYIQLEIVT